MATKTAQKTKELDQLLAEDPDLAERSLDTEEGRARAALAEAERRHIRRDATERARRVQGALIRRGFDWSTVRDLVTHERDESQEPH